MNLQSLPTELLIEIISYIADVSIYNISLLSHFWNNFIKIHKEYIYKKYQKLYSKDIIFVTLYPDMIQNDEILKLIFQPINLNFLVFANIILFEGTVYPINNVLYPINSFKIKIISTYSLENPINGIGYINGNFRMNNKNIYPKLDSDYFVRYLYDLNYNGLNLNYYHELFLEFNECFKYITLKQNKINIDDFPFIKHLFNNIDYDYLKSLSNINTITILHYSNFSKEVLVKNFKIGYNDISGFYLLLENKNNFEFKIILNNVNVEMDINHQNIFDVYQKNMIYASKKYLLKN